MTPDVAARFAWVFGSRLSSTSGGVPTACLGRDSRASGESLAEAAANGLMAAGCDVIDLGVVATPTTGVMVTATGSAGGIMITASHNPNPWNGIKCIEPGGSAPPAAVAEEVIAGFRGQEGDLPSIDPDRTLSMESRGDDTHIARVLGLVDPGPICAKNYGVVLDSVNGSGCRSGLKLLELLGCDVLHLNGEPTGEFAHTPEPKESNLGSLMEVTAESDVVIGFAQDPDADRLAIVDGSGRYIGEEYTLALVTDYMLSRQGGGVVVTNLSTSRMVDDIATRYGARVVRTAVGEANVVEAMRSEDALIGGEGNGGVIVPGVCHIRDSLGAMALVLASMAATGRTLEELVDDIPSYAMIKRFLRTARFRWARGGRPGPGDGPVALRLRIDRCKRRRPHRLRRCLGARAGEQHRTDCEDHRRGAPVGGCGGIDRYRRGPGGLDGVLGLRFVDRGLHRGLAAVNVGDEEFLGVRSHHRPEHCAVGLGQVQRLDVILLHPDERPLLELVDGYFRGLDGASHPEAEQQPMPISLVSGL